MFPQEQRLKKVKHDESGFKYLARPEEESIAWMKDILQTFTKPGIMVLDACAETLSFADDCLHFPKNERIVICWADPNYVTEVIMSYFWSLFDSRCVRSRKWNAMKKAQTSAKLYEKAAQSPDVRKPLDVREDPELFASIWTICPHIPYHLSTYLGEEELFKIRENFPAN